MFCLFNVDGQLLGAIILSLTLGQSSLGCTYVCLLMTCLVCAIDLFVYPCVSSTGLITVALQ